MHVCNPFSFPKGVTTVVEVHTLRLGLFCPMERHHSWSLSEFDVILSNVAFEFYCLCVFDAVKPVAPFEV